MDDLDVDSVRVAGASGRRPARAIRGAPRFLRSKDSDSRRHSCHGRSTLTGPARRAVWRAGSAHRRTARQTRPTPRQESPARRQKSLSGRQSLFHAVICTFHGVTFIFHDVNYTFHAVKQTFGRRPGFLAGYGGTLIPQRQSPCPPGDPRVASPHLPSVYAGLTHARRHFSMPRPMLFAEKAVYLSLPRDVRTVRRAAQERLSNPIKTAFEEPDTTTT